MICIKNRLITAKRDVESIKISVKKVLFVGLIFQYNCDDYHNCEKLGYGGIKIQNKKKH